MKDDPKMIKMISSASNENYKMLSDLGSSAGIKKHSCFIVMGQDILRENLNSLRPQVIAEIRTESLLALDSSFPQWVLSPSLFKQIDALGTKYNLLLLRLSQLPDFDFNAPPQGLELLVPLGDPNNLGSLARSAWGFSVSKMILTTEAAHPFHPKAIKSSAGAILKMNLSKAPALQALAGFEFWALDMSGQDLRQIKFPKNLRLLVGEEGPGLGDLKNSPNITQKLRISTQGVESLNATVATSLALYEYQRQFNL
jgi:TrmH family RNA methyltransferase